MGWKKTGEFGIKVFVEYKWETVEPRESRLSSVMYTTVLRFELRSSVLVSHYLVNWAVRIPKRASLHPLEKKG